ncbi:MAG TPA: LptF/LptG family permease, partial [Verrucomicrobiae bacterium]|nr:LptF/LptG family permease [Verrucomicrobiae bacterium]
LDVIEYSAAQVPGFLVTVLPVALLLALLYTLTNHARHNEITAMRAAGISLWRICLPYFAVGLVASLALFALNEQVAPRSTEWANRILERYTSKPDDGSARNQQEGSYLNARARRTWYYDAFNSKNAEMIGPHVSWYLPDGSFWEIKAGRAVHTNKVWVFFNAIEYKQASQTTNEAPILVTNVLTMPQFNETPKDIERDLRFAKYNLRSNKLDVPLTELWEYLQAHPNLPRARASVWQTKFDGRLATPWTCLVVVFIAIPFGAASGRRNLFFGVAGSIFICFAFYAVQQFSLAFGSGGHIPPWLAAWLPNMLFVIAGLVMMARVR